MDETLIRMMDCPEIQSQLRAKQGMLFAGEALDEGSRPHMAFIDGPDIHLITHLCILHSWKAEGRILIARQEDIQKMLGGPTEESLLFEHLQSLVGEIYYFANPIEGGYDKWRDREKYLSQFRSMEQLLLAYYMEKRHSKTWTEEGWA